MSMSLMLLAVATATPNLPSSPDLGKAEGRCRPNESGASFLVNVVGLRDRKGMLKAELYPANDEDFLQDDNVLIMAGKTFRRVEMDVPQSGPVSLCIRAPGPGPYALMLLHDRDSNRKLGLSVDGVGFPGDPKMCWGAPKGSKVVATAQSGPTNLTITMQYRASLVCFGPLKK